MVKLDYTPIKSNLIPSISSRRPSSSPETMFTPPGKEQNTHSYIHVAAGKHVLCFRKSLFRTYLPQRYGSVCLSAYGRIVVPRGVSEGRADGNRLLSLGCKIINSKFSKKNACSRGEAQRVHKICMICESRGHFLFSRRIVLDVGHIVNTLWKNKNIKKTDLFCGCDGTLTGETGETYLHF